MSSSRIGFQSILITILFLGTPQVYGFEQIIRPYQSVRSAGMGGVKVTTGLYDENFFGNPARAAANPAPRTQLFGISAESNWTALSAASNAMNASSDLLNKISDTAGNDIHTRFQTAFPAFYRPHPEDKVAWAVGLFSSTQTDLALLENYQIDPRVMLDIGPAFTIARRLLFENALTLGFNLHMNYRASTPKHLSVIDLIKGTSISPLRNGGDGMGADFDMGFTYLTHWHLWHMKTMTLAGSINNMTGTYSQFNMHLLNTGKFPERQPLSMNLGIAGTYDQWWKFWDVVFAVEIQDIRNNTDGSIFRTFHAGVEGRWKKALKARLGLFQGYLSGGIGLDWKLVQIDLATYAEELSLNAGGYEDRRYAVEFGLHL